MINPTARNSARALLLAGLCACSWSWAQERPQLTAAQAATYSVDAALRWVGPAGRERDDPWQPLADPLATGAQFKADLVVDTAVTGADGRNFATIQQAVDHAIHTARGKARVFIEVKPGVYHGLLYVPAAPFAITLYSQASDAGATRIRADIDSGLSGTEYAALFGAQFAHSPSSVRAMFDTLAARPAIATPGAALAWIQNDGFQVRNITFENYHSKRWTPDCTSAPCQTARPMKRDSQGQNQALAMLVDGADKVQFENLRLLGHQDTLFLRSPAPGSTTRSFFHHSYIEGDVDFIFGDATAYFYRSEIKSIGARHGNSYVTAPNTNLASRYGFVFNECNFTHDGSAAALEGRFFFARQWFNRQQCTPYAPLANTEDYRCTIGPADSYAAPHGTISKLVLEGVGKTIILNSRIGAHISRTRPWSNWNKPGSKAYRPAQYDLDGFWRNLETVGIDPARQLGLRRGPNMPFLAEFNNIDEQK